MVRETDIQILWQYFREGSKIVKVSLLGAIFFVFFSSITWAGDSINGKGLLCPCINKNQWNCESPQIFRFNDGNWNHICINVYQDIAEAVDCGTEEYFSSTSEISTRHYRLDRSNLDLYLSDSKSPKWRCNKITKSDKEFKSEVKKELEKRQKLYDAALVDKKI